MALTINNFTGFETQGNEEASATASTPAYATTGQRTGGACLEVNGVGESYDLPWVVPGVTDAGNKHIVFFAFKCSSGAGRFTVYVLDDSAGVIAQVGVLSAGDLRLYDANGTALDTTSGTDYRDASWHTIHVYADLNSASGGWEWWVDGTSEGSGSAADLTDGNAFGSASSALRLERTAGTVNFDDVYILSGATATTDKFDDAEVFMYQNGAGATQTPDGGLVTVGTSGGDATDLGNWSTTADTPYSSTTIRYDVTAARGGSVDTDHSTRGGPSGDTNIDGDANIKSVKGVWEADRSNGSGTTFYLGMGDSGDTNVADNTVTLGTSNPAFYERIFTNLPTSSQFIRMGVGKSSGGRDIFCREMWAMVLHVPAGGTTIDMALASFAFSGKDPVLTKQTPFNAALNAFTFAGLDPTLSTQTPILVDLASFTVAGLDPILTRQIPLNIDLASFTFAGLDPVISVNTPISMDSATFTFAGLDPILTRSLLFSADLGTFTFAGLDPTLTRQLLFSPDLATFTFSGLDLTLLVTTPISMDLATYTFSGLDPDLTRQIPIDMELAILSLSGNDHTITRQIPFPVDLATFSFSGLDPIIQVSIPILMNLGTFTFTGLDANFVAQIDFLANTGVFNFNGQNLTLTRQIPIEMALANYTLAGLNPTITTQIIMDMDQGSFSLAGLDLTITRALIINMDKGSFVFSGLDPILFRALIMNMDLGSYTFSGEELVITVNTPINMDLASFVLAGQDLTALRSIIVNMDAGAFTFSGLNALLEVITLLGNFRVSVISASGNQVILDSSLDRNKITLSDSQNSLELLDNTNEVTE
jgi:hypothetical protein